MNVSQRDPDTLTPEVLIWLELQRLIRLNDALQVNADTPYAVGAEAINLICETSQTILRVGARMPEIEPDVYLTEARRLHGVSEKIEPITECSEEWVGVLLNNAGLIARLLEEAALTAARMKRYRQETRPDPSVPEA